LTERRSTGRLCFAWYRINITVPERVGAFDTKVRFARLSFYRAAPGPVAIPVSEVNVEVIRKDPAMDAIVGANPKIFKLAEGFQFTEGPIWIRDGGYLLFSDPNANTIYKYVPDRQLSVFRTPSGYSGADIAEYGQPGSNGLTVDRQGRLTINEHGNRRVTRLEKDGSLTVLADRYQGKRLNSPNDLDAVFVRPDRVVSHAPEHRGGAAVKRNEVLLVCATAEAGDTLTGILRKDRWAVQPAQSAEEALDHLSRHTIPVVICESSLPDGDWKDLLSKAPRLIVTARNADDALWAEVLNLGGYDVLAQPFDEGEVSRVVASAGRN
jgi:hypothetical protein